MITTAPLRTRTMTAHFRSSKDLKKGVFSLKRKHSRERRTEALQAYVLLLPTLLGMAFLSVGATIGAIALGFTDYSVKWPPNFIGLNNYRLLFTNRIFPTVIRVTFTSALINVVPCVLIALLLALLVNQPIRGARFWRAVYFWPVVGSMTAISLLWGFLLNPQFGLVNYLLATLGVRGPDWFSSTRWSIVAIGIIFVWKNVGYYMTMLLAGLQGIPESLYESAMIDGAGPFRRTFSITLPMLSPSLFFVTIMACIASFQVFDPILVTGLNGGPAHSTTTLSYYVYQNAFQFMKMGFASACATVLFLIIAAFTLLQFKLQDKWVFYG